MIILTDKTNVTGFSNVVLENKLESGGKQKSPNSSRIMVLLKSSSQS